MERKRLRMPPSLGGVAEVAVVSKVYCREQDQLSPGDPLIEVLNSACISDVTSSITCTVVEMSVKDGGLLNPNDTIAVVDVE